jgi:hypothetical protein
MKSQSTIRGRTKLIKCVARAQAAGPPSKLEQSTTPGGVDVAIDSRTSSQAAEPMAEKIICEGKTIDRRGKELTQLEVGLQ